MDLILELVKVECQSIWSRLPLDNKFQRLKAQFNSIITSRCVNINRTTHQCSKRDLESQVRSSDRQIRRASTRETSSLRKWRRHKHRAFKMTLIRGDRK
jgi:hypothetical protein